MLNPDEEVKEDPREERKSPPPQKRVLYSGRVINNIRVSSGSDEGQPQASAGETPMINKDTEGSQNGQ